MEEFTPAKLQKRILKIVHDVLLGILRDLKNDYESKIKNLEGKVAALEAKITANEINARRQIGGTNVN
jgi:hypothetical protein